MLPLHIGAMPSTTNQKASRSSSSARARRGHREPASACSILALYDPNGALADGREELMRELSARMRTRGPDGSGCC